MVIACLSHVIASFLALASSSTDSLHSNSPHAPSISNGNLSRAQLSTSHVRHASCLILIDLNMLLSLVLKRSRGGTVSSRVMSSIPSHGELLKIAL